MAAQPTQNDVYRAHRGLLGADWRYRLALTLPPHLPARLAQSHDAYVRDLRKYVTLDDEGAAARAKERFPTIAAAEELGRDDPQVAMIMVMVLGDLPIDEIAQRTGVAAAVIAMWERCFFDARDLRHAVSWLSAHVIAKARKEGNVALAARLKFAACAGPDGVRVMLDAEEGLPVDEADRLFQQKLRLHVKMDEATEMPFESGRDAANFLVSVTRIRLEEKRIELASQKLQQKCLAARDRHELALQKVAVWGDELKRRAQERELRRAARGVGGGVEHPSDNANAMSLAARAARSALAQLKWGVPDAKPTADVAARILSFAEASLLGGPTPRSRHIDEQRDGSAEGTAIPSTERSEPNERLLSA